MTVAGVVMAHPKRRAWAEELSVELELPIVWDRVNDRHDTGLRCIEAGVDAAADHWLIVQDDAIVCRDLVAGVEAAATVSRNRVIGLYVGNTRPQTGRVEKLIAAVRANGSSWLEAPGPWWGVGIVIPVPYLPNLAEAFARSTEQNYDRRVEKWVERTRVGCWYTVPSLVDHRHGDENPSLVEGRGCDGRRARYFIGADESALSIDWTRAPIEGELWRNLRTGQIRNVRSDSPQASRFARSPEWARVAAYPEGVAKICLVCGTVACACGPSTDVVAVDQRVRSRERMAGPLKRYPNPTRPGSFLKLTEADARRLGLTGGTPVAPVAPPVRLDDLANEGRSGSVEPATGPGLVRSSTVAAGPASSSPGSEGPPPGALAPGGPTRRARSRAKAAPDAPATGDPKDKARPAPSRRRRRVVEDD